MAVRRCGGMAVGPLAIRAMGLAGVLLTAGPADRLIAQDVTRGKAVYEKWCLECHGETGAGDGSAAAFMLPRPRDFTRAVYQIRTTASGELPTDADIRRVVDEGMPGTAMPEWKTRLSETERADVVAYLKTLSSFFEGEPPKPIEIGKPPAASAEGVAEGRKVFDQLECFKCHGQGGRGDGQSAPTLKDDWDAPIRAADLTQSWMFNGGASVEQIYTRLRTGLDGTPMPSFSDVIDAKVITDEQLWRVAQYVHSLSPAEPPQVREVIRATLSPTLPSSPEDSAWARAEPFFIPLVGQIIRKPRWFAPSVEAVWVQAMHDGRQLALRLTWHDRSKSPDPAWDEWLGRVTQVTTDVDGPVGTVQGPDRLTVQFPVSFTDDVERPYFLGGTSRRPVYQWRWSSDPDRLEEGSATGLNSFAARSGSPEVTHAARYADGEWQLQITRALVSADSGKVLSFTPGVAIPIAFSAADGSNGEDVVRSSVSAWYAVYLDVPTPPSVYVAPVVAMILTAGLGLMVVWRAQQRERQG